MNEHTPGIDAVMGKVYSNLLSTADKTAATTKVAILSTERCGSKLFCYSLHNTGLFGTPHEWCNPRFISTYMRVAGQQFFDLAAYLHFIATKTTSSNGVYSINFHIDQLMFLREKFGYDLGSAGFDRIYYLSRRDLIAQALSFVKARMTDQWTSQVRPARQFSAAAIRDSDICRTLLELFQQREFYQTNYARLVRREYVYEQFCGSDACYGDILTDCGISFDAGLEFRCSLSRQRENDDEERAVRFFSTLTGGSAQP